MKIIVIGSNPEQVRGYDHESWEDEVSWEDYAMWGFAVNEIYTTLQDWIDGRPAVMDDDYTLVGVGVELPPASDPVYSPYNQDITYTFTVTQQQTVKSFDFNFNFNF